MTRHHPKVEYQGILAYPIEHARRLGISEEIYKRIAKYGLAPDALPKVFGPPERGTKYEYDGITATIADHAKRLGITRTLAYMRFRMYGPASLDKVFGPVKKPRLVTYDGITETVTAHARRLGLNMSTVDRRVERFGLAPEALPLVFSRCHVITRGARYTAHGVTDSVSGWSHRLGMTTGAIYDRLAKYPPEVALTLPKREGEWRYHTKPTHMITYNGETHSIGQWALKLGIGAAGIRGRFLRGLPTEEVLYPTRSTFSRNRKHREFRRFVDRGQQKLRKLGLIV